ncbi:MAG: TetR/AcrR family transcriptional regulator [Oscillospiraceae bacterium]|nr:TetR/AcrR family transcriptional regulator [Oscillospiraceae bacterium]
MDLRQQKTKRSIINAFLRLRSKKPLEKITVRELSELAEIHKATFYLHYHDIYELSESLERELIESILAGISDPASFLTNTERFNEELYCLLISHESMLGILFSGSRAGLLADMLEKHIKNYIFNFFPEYRDDPQKNIILTYLIQGSYRAYMQYYRTTDPKQLVHLINSVSADILQKIF